MQTLSDVSCQYGAPMGRRSDNISDCATIEIERMQLYDGGYDAGGAYWGSGQPLYRVSTDDGEVDFFRAASDLDALAKITSSHPNATVTTSVERAVYRTILCDCTPEESSLDCVPEGREDYFTPFCEHCGEHGDVVDTEPCGDEWGDR